MVDAIIVQDEVVTTRVQVQLADEADVTRRVQRLIVIEYGWSMALSLVAAVIFAVVLVLKFRSDPNRTVDVRLLLAFIFGAPLVVMGVGSATLRVVRWHLGKEIDIATSQADAATLASRRLELTKTTRRSISPPTIMIKTTSRVEPKDWAESLRKGNREAVLASAIHVV